jgi:hypothetical protein
LSEGTKLLNNPQQSHFNSIPFASSSKFSINLQSSLSVKLPPAPDNPITPKTKSHAVTRHSLHHQLPNPYFRKSSRLIMNMKTEKPSTFKFHFPPTENPLQCEKMETICVISPLIPPRHDLICEQTGEKYQSLMSKY